MINLDSLFPKAQGKPPNGNILLPNNLRNLRFLSWRNKGKRDDLRPVNSIPIGITKKGIDLQNRIVYRKASGVKVFQSYPLQFEFFGTENQQLERIGNSVPPPY